MPSNLPCISTHSPACKTLSWQGRCGYMNCCRGNLPNVKGNVQYFKPRRCNTLNIALDVRGRGVWGTTKGYLPAEYFPYFAIHKIQKCIHLKVNAINPQVEQKGKVVRKNKIIDKHTELWVPQGKATEMLTSAQVRLDAVAGVFKPSSTLTASKLISYHNLVMT